MEGLLTDLVANGVKYTPRGGQVRLRVTGADGSIRIVVADTGIGIPREDLEKIFSEFYRSENARKLSFEGTGLGMSIVKAIVEAHGGPSPLRASRKRELASK
jgi:signal transduction histidine kinase